MRGDSNLCLTPPSWGRRRSRRACVAVPGSLSCLEVEVRGRLRGEGCRPQVLASAACVRPEVPPWTGPARRPGPWPALEPGEYQRRSSLLWLWPWISVLMGLFFSEAGSGWVSQGLPLSPTLPRAPVASAGFRVGRVQRQVYTLLQLCKQQLTAPSHVPGRSLLSGTVGAPSVSRNQWEWVVGGDKKGDKGREERETESMSEEGTGPRWVIKHPCRYM